MRVCIVCIELFGDSVYGGFGRATRVVARELVRRGVEVSIVVPRRSRERPDQYELDGAEVRQFRPARLDEAIRALRGTRADVFHSQDPSIVTALARIAAPSAAHVVTFRDPLDEQDWRVETRYAAMPRVGWRMYRGFVSNPLVARSVRTADGLHCAARFLAEKARHVYRLPRPPGFLPTPVAIPAQAPKAARPLVCSMGRWDARKRVELFLDLAGRFPDVKFVAAGAAREPTRDAALRTRYGGLPNLRLPGVLDQFADPAWSELLSRSWVLVNTSAREGLPTAFVEAAAHGCSILGFSDPDGFASRFGRLVREGELDAGLRWLLAGDRWRELGTAARDEVAATFAVDRAMDAHLVAYDEALARAAGRR